MTPVMLTVADVRARIHAGHTLFLAGDEQVLRQLPQGNWIGGTIPYFMTERGGAFTQELLYVTELPASFSCQTIRWYPAEQLTQIYTDIPEQGVGFILIPATSPAHLSFALHAPTFPGFATRPLIGWITGVPLDQVGQLAPKVFDGRHAQMSDDGALVLHCTLPEQQFAEINMINLFEQGAGDVITFPSDTFTATDAFINGKRCRFVEYLRERQLDLKLPLVADYAGARINTSFQQLDQQAGTVSFYAPVFQGIEYKQAKPIGSYVEQFTAQIAQIEKETIFFSCNCILNYLYAELEGKQTEGITGPMTFGEIAYQLVNQTLVYLTVSEQFS